MIYCRYIRRLLPLNKPALPSALLVSLLLLVSSCGQEQLRIGAATTLEDSGLLAHLVHEFKQQHPINVTTIVDGSGHILRMAQASDIDIVLTHDPKGEQALINSGIGLARYPLMHNDFIIVGPTTDPAHVHTALTLDEALRKIAFARSAFISRGDNSGTHKFEMHWRQNIPTAADNTRYISTGTGMGATLAMAIEKNAYTLVDRATWLNTDNKKPLKVLFEDAEVLINQYSVITLNPKKHVEHHTALAQQWLDWLLSDAGKQAIAQYRTHNQQAFFITPPTITN